MTRPGTPPPGPAADVHVGPAAPRPGSAQGFGVRLTAPLLMGSLLNPLNTTMISTALVAIGHSFGIGAADTAWLISVLYLASAVAQPVLGKLADVLGPRRVFLAGLVVVMASGLVGALASGFGMLIVSRLLLGIGTSAAYPAAMAVLRDESRRVGRVTPRPVLARLSFAALGSAAVGPALGGLLVTFVGWRGIFAVNVPVALLAFGAALVWVPADPPRARDGQGNTPKLALDPLGIGLFSAALTVLVFFLLRLTDPLWWLAAPFAVLTAVLAWWQLRTPRPFIDLRMLAGNGALLRTYARQGLSYLLIYCVMYGFTQWLEEARGYSSGHTGLLMLPMSLTALACSLLGARTKSLRAPLTLACGLLMAGAGILLTLSGSTPLAVLLLAGACFGAPQGLIGTSNQAAVQAHAPPEAIGSAAGLQRTAQYLGAITASGLIALAYADAASDAGLHLMAAVSVVLGVLLTVLTVTDRALRART
ncbi:MULTISPECIES: MFS transporter [unclassified Streptomyces]|uniref:MFS transporter n=1 Tax=unclassified Streptomyces TaxID=2593676 RepID=UPI0001C1CFA3|nr:MULTISPECIES: MFS transporter [unclassified Streptomyces]MYR68118.1 MFS transporter [Streptomyces sp. SID4939]MYS01275.1 MFS transporter [Streptomyces sp. SID4940]MYT63286.1 MFS transporter [Streptomyces sp. SID8357]MYT88438.1 MFS transporter [Streptomyces sp. SID8360]MYU33349.1 MFS transporter [Streptomyces sp. SID8358]MYW39628.1 MFS transporter [Streptomyces sp. SID1]